MDAGNQRKRRNSPDRSTDSESVVDTDATVAEAESEDIIRRLKTVYDSVLDEPIPQDLVELIRRNRPQ